MPTQIHNINPVANKARIKRLPVFEEEQELQKYLEVNFAESLKQMIKITIKTMVKQEMESFRQEFDEKLHFNGNYYRQMTSTFGRVEDIPIPRFRQSLPQKPNLQSLSVFEGEQEKFFKLIEQMHLLGISQRKIKRLASSCLGINISVDRVGTIYRELAEKEEYNINSQSLDDDFEWLLLDGVWAKTKGYGWQDNQSVLLCALGIRPNGERKIVGFSLARNEDRESWQKLISSLKLRGLTGEQLKLLIIDDNQGLKNALNQLYPKLPVQTCIVHKMRNISAKTSYRHRAKVMEETKTIFAKETKDQAIEQAKAVVKKWYLTEPRAMESLKYNLEDCLTYLLFPKDQWTKLRTTNLLEREFREVRRRIKVFDNTFQNDDSAIRYMNTIFTNLNNTYPQSLHTKT